MTIDEPVHRPSHRIPRCVSSSTASIGVKLLDCAKVLQTMTVGHTFCVAMSTAKLDVVTVTQFYFDFVPAVFFCARKRDMRCGKGNVLASEVLLILGCRYSKKM